MKKTFENTLFIFRRDLRIQDNTGLIHALKNSENVFCIFIFTPEQIKKNPYRSDFALRFMLESLEDLEEEIKKQGGSLSFFFDTPEKAVAECIRTIGIDCVTVNTDYTPYAVLRDQKIKQVCDDHGVIFLSFEDLLLHPSDEMGKPGGGTYAVFTPFYKNIGTRSVALPNKNRGGHYAKDRIGVSKEKTPFREYPELPSGSEKGGRKEGIKILKHLSRFASYEENRDFPASDATTRLSPHLKFTTVSPREVHQVVTETLGSGHPLIRSLYWRDFFTFLAFRFPHVFTGSFHKKFDALEWDSDPSRFRLWCEGNTGFPIVDAGMRELNATGFMHNRVRMITASFLVKDLHIHWKEGERYFAKHLIDYDPAVNNGNWQWAASTGCDAQPYFRVFNPWLQQEKFDPDCSYIKTWIPELEDADPKTIHQGNKKRISSRYLLPILDHAKEAKIAIERYRSL